MAALVRGCVERGGDEIGGEGRAGLDISVFAMTEKSEWADDGNQGGGVGKVGLAFESSGTAQV